MFAGMAPMLTGMAGSMLGGIPGGGPGSPPGNPIGDAQQAIGEMRDATTANMMMQREGTKLNAAQSRETQRSSIMNEANKAGTSVVTSIAQSASQAVQSAFKA